MKVAWLFAVTYGAHVTFDTVLEKYGVKCVSIKITGTFLICFTGFNSFFIADTYLYGKTKSGTYLYGKHSPASSGNFNLIMETSTQFWQFWQFQPKNGYKCPKMAKKLSKNLEYLLLAKKYWGKPWVTVLNGSKLFGHSVQENPLCRFDGCAPVHPGSLLGCRQLLHDRSLQEIRVSGVYVYLFIIRYKIIILQFV